MAKHFYSDKDIEELHRNGVKSLQITDDVVLTDLAYEKARRLGLQLSFDGADMPPAAPVRPYLSEMKPHQSKPNIDSAAPAFSKPQSTPNPGQSAGREKGIALEKRIRERVAAQLGNQIEPQLLDSILKRTLKVLGVK